MRVCARYVPVVRVPRLPQRMAPPLVREAYPWERWTEGRYIPTRWAGPNEGRERRWKPPPPKGTTPLDEELYEESLQSIGEKLGITRQAVSLFLLRSFERLRSPEHKARVVGRLATSVREMRKARAEGDLEREWAAAQRVDDLTEALGLLDEFVASSAAREGGLDESKRPRRWPPSRSSRSDT